MNLPIDHFAGSNASQQKANVFDPPTNVLVIVVSVSIAETETCQVSFTTKRVKQPISPRLWESNMEAQTRSAPPKGRFKTLNQDPKSA